MHDELLLILFSLATAMLLGVGLGWLGAVYREGKTRCPRCRLEWYPGVPVVEITEERQER